MTSSPAAAAAAPCGRFFARHRLRPAPSADSLAPRSLPNPARACARLGSSVRGTTVRTRGRAMRRQLAGRQSADGWRSALPAGLLLLPRERARGKGGGVAAPRFHGGRWHPAIAPGEERSWFGGAASVGERRRPGLSCVRDIESHDQTKCWQSGKTWRCPAPQSARGSGCNRR